MRTDLKCLAISKLLLLLVMLICVGSLLKLRGNLSQARMTSLRMGVISIQQALEDFKTKTGKYPERITDIFNVFDADTVKKIETLNLLYSVNITCDKYTLKAGESIHVANKKKFKIKQRFWIHIAFGVSIISLFIILFKRKSNTPRWVTRILFSDYFFLTAMFLLMLLLAVDLFNLIS